MKFIAAIGALFSAVGYVFKFLCGRQATAKAREAKAAQKDVAKEQQKIAEEVRNKDVDAVNARIQSFRRTPLPLVTIAVAVFALAGCTTTKVVYVEEQDKVVPMQHAGQSGWWVPDHVMIDILTRLDEAERQTKKAKMEATRP